MFAPNVFVGVELFVKPDGKSVRLISNMLLVIYCSRISVASKSSKMKRRAVRVIRPSNLSG